MTSKCAWVALISLQSKQDTIKNLIVTALIFRFLVCRHCIKAFINLKCDYTLQPTIFFFLFIFNNQNDLCITSSFVQDHMLIFTTVGCSFCCLRVKRLNCSVFILWTRYHLLYFSLLLFRCSLPGLPTSLRSGYPVRPYDGRC